MERITERIVNIKELEDLIEEAYIMAQFLQKESSQGEKFQPLIENLREASEFELRIEERKINY